MCIDAGVVTLIVVSLAFLALLIWAFGGNPWKGPDGR